MKRRGRNERLKTAYKRAFEESFVDNFDGWNDTLKDVNVSIEAIAKGRRRKCHCYTYDTFCALAKSVIDQRLESLDWDEMVVEFGSRMTSGKGNYVAQVQREIAIMETEMLFACFEKAILSSVGPRLYRLYKHEIEQFKAEEVVL